MAKDDSPTPPTGLDVCTGSSLQALWSLQNKAWKRAFATALKNHGEVWWLGHRS